MGEPDEMSERPHPAFQHVLPHEADEGKQPEPAAGWYSHPTMTDTVRYWDGKEWTDHIAPASSHSAASEAPAAKGVACPYCGSNIHPEASRCAACSGELRFCPRCVAMRGLTSKQKFVGVLRGGTKTQYRCKQCAKILDGPRF